MCWATAWCARRARARRAQNFIAEASSLTPGDLVTHIEHGVGRYIGLKAIDALGAPHDCLELQYDGGKLFLPVENIELLTRYGSDEGAQLDRLGGAGWQQRKARMKERVRAIAAELIKIAAARQLKSLPPVEPPSGLYDEFSARFPYQETEDQEKAIGEVVADLAAGPADGPAGVRRCRFRQDRSRDARRLCRRHGGRAGGGGGAHDASGAPALSRLCRTLCRISRSSCASFPALWISRRRRKPGRRWTKARLILWWARMRCSAESINFKRLGLVIVDEEQHFGVIHKERLKNLKADVHVLTLTATPIPAHLAAGACRACATCR